MTTGEREDAGRTVPVVEEEVQVGTEEIVTDTVRVRTVVREDEQVIDVPLTDKRVEVTRVPVDRVCEQPVPDRQEGDTTIISLHREVFTVLKHYQIYEEIHVRTVHEQRHHQEVVHARRSDLVIERS